MYVFFVLSKPKPGDEFRISDWSSDVWSSDLLGRDDVEHEAGFGGHARDEFGAVRGAAAGLGRHRSRERDAAMAQFVRTHCKRGDRAVDRRQIGRAHV